MSFTVNSTINKSDAEAVRTSLQNLFLDAVDLPAAEQREFIRVHCEKRSRIRRRARRAARR
jgi:hypothetical protein